MIAIVDYGVGNLFSLKSSLAAIGAEAVVTGDADVLRKADILISDFSGVIFDFALVFDKPILYADTSFDKSPYDACWLDDELWTFRTLPKIGEQLSEEKLDRLKEIIDECLSAPERQEARDAARAETWAYPGEAAVRVVDYLIEKQDAILKAEAEAAQKPEKTRRTKKEKKQTPEA